MKNTRLEFDNHIKDINELIEQLKSLKQDARINMPIGEIFVKDYHALRIVINYLEYLKNFMGEKR